MSTTHEQFKALDPDTQAFFNELVQVGRENFPGREGLIEFHKGLKLVEQLITETREEAGF